MKAHNVSIGLNKSSTSLDLLILEQEEWNLYTGYLTNANMVRIVAEYLFNEDFGASVNCGVGNGSLITTVFAYPLIPDLQFKLKISRGTLSDPKFEIYEYTEVVKFTLEDESSLKYPVKDIKEKEWLSESNSYDCFDINGTPIKGVNITVDSQKVYTDRKVYGSVRIKYTTIRYRYGVSIPHRDETLENSYDSVVYALYTGGFNYLKLDKPDNIETFEADENADCIGGNTSDWGIQPTDKIPPDKHKNAHRKKVIQYCGQKVLSDEVYGY